MNPDRLRQVEELYHSAREREPGERGAFLVEACRGDEELRHDVESLLAQSGSGDVMDRPALDLAASLLAEIESPLGAGTVNHQPLSAGTRLGPYEILALIGKGGMGEVYRARDPRLRRDVAIKIAAERFSAGFEREARAAAALNHPNVCTLHDIGPDYLVMELVEGPTLAERLKKGPIALEEALNIARQIADALESAHEKHIVHRDLKPGNIKIKPDGAVKVLDFGLAKRVGASASAGGVAESLTLTMNATEEGIVGTVPYMAPEQASGGTVDRRADVWAFGAVLYEMVAGKRLFTGTTIPEVLSGIIAKEPSLDAAHPAVRPLIAKCLRKDPRKRWQWMGDVRLAIEERTGSVPSAPSALSRSMPWAIAAVLLLALGSLATVHFREAALQPAPARFTLPIPGGSAFEVTFALSPDSHYLAISAVEAGLRKLWVRPIDSLEARLLPGTEGATYPFWAPDGGHIGFFAGGKLKSVSRAGEAIVTISDAPGGPRGATWNRDGVIVFSTGKLFRVDAIGGVPAPLYPGNAATVETGPWFLPDGQHFLYLQFRGGEAQGIRAGSLDGAASRRLLADQSNPAYAPSTIGGRVGHLLFRRGSTLMAERFDPESLKLFGSVSPVVDGITGLGYAPHAVFAVSATGALAYQSVANEQLVWVDRRGSVQEKVGPPGGYRNFRLSPSGTKIVMDRDRVTGTRMRPNIWLLEIASGIVSRMTLGVGGDNLAIWAPDSKRILFVTFRDAGLINLYLTSAAGQEQKMVEVGTTGGWPVDWSMDNRYILYSRPGEKTGVDLWIAPTTKGTEPYPFVQSRFDDTDGAFSPDGQWVAYVSDESGRKEVYVRPFSGGGSPRQISGDGGSAPAWRRDGNEFFYVAGDGHLMALPVNAGESALRFGRPQSLFPTPPGSGRRNYEVSADGKRFLIPTPADPGGATFTVLLNWQHALGQ